MTSSRRRRTKKKNTIVNFMTKIHANRHADTRTDRLTLLYTHTLIPCPILHKKNKLRQNLNPKKQNHHT